MLLKRETKLASALHSLCHALKSAESMAVSVDDLLTHAEASFQRALPPKPGFSKLSNDRLHDLRKAAKRSRYMAESAPRSPRAAAAAGRYETLQASGGKWHDALALTSLSRKDLGSKHALTRRLHSLRSHQHSSFLSSLQEFIETGEL
jgi:CHAD domain-containing protein